MKIRLGLIAFALIGCNAAQNETHSKGTDTNGEVKVVSAMKNVMRKGQLEGSIRLDTISDKKGLYGIGPEAYLKGELLINDGVSYVSRVTTDSTMTVEKQYEVDAPFFVYGHVTEWNEMDLPTQIVNIQDLERFIDQKRSDFNKPFVFKLTGRVAKADIHIQNLPDGTKVSSPAEAHQGQVSYIIEDEEVEIVGFFSTQHQGIFTHHDTYLHMHLITADEQKMGHLDTLEMAEMKLYLPKRISTTNMRDS